MVVEHTRALVSYDDRKKSSSQNRDYEVAWQCANFLKQKGVDAAVKGYSDSTLDAATQWLILIHSSEARPPSSLVNDVNTALDSVVARRMRDVMVISTDSSDLRREWASIRKYDASNPQEESAALSDMLRAMKSVKLPYTQALNQQQKRRGLWNGQQKRPSIRRLAVPIFALVIIMLVVAGTIIHFYLPGYLHPNSTSAAATASARATMTRSTGTVTATQTIPGGSAATQNAKRKELRTLTNASPTIQGFQTANKWSTATAASSCTLANTTYTVDINASNQYKPCLAANPLFMNFVMQVTMKIQGDAGGIIFRSDSHSKEYYRLSVNQSDATTPTMDTFSLLRCDADCTDNSVTSGTSMTDNINTSVQVDRTKSIALTLVARANTFNVFINGQFVASITDTSFTTPWPGQIGVYAASLTQNTTVTFSNLKVWALKDNTLAPPTSTPTTPSVIQPTVIGTQGA